MSLCIGCMHEIGNEMICPDCGFNNSQNQSAPFLPYGVVLNGRYIVGRNMETNGESVLYIGFDRQNSTPVLIREFLPAGYFSRAEGNIIVRVDSSREDVYNSLLENFEHFFGFLSTLRDMSAMNVITDVFRANNTCYVVEEYEELITFEDYVKRNNGHLEWEVARPLFMPVISLLEALHKNGFGHFGISPTNLYVTTSGKLLLLGFATVNERRRGTLLKSQLFSGCAAPEQYEKNFPIDNITDIYGFTATLFYALTGSLPADARERIGNGALLMSTATVKRMPPHVVSALANGLQVKREERIIDFGDLRSQLSVAPTVKAIQEEISRTASMANSIKKEKKNYGMSPVSVGIIVTVIASLFFIFIGKFLIVDNLVNNDSNANNQQATTENITPTVNNTDWTGPVLENYVGKDFDQVRADLSAQGVIVYQDTYANEDDGYSDKYDKGVIVAQSFAQGTPIDAERGFAISFKVSKGPKTAELPDIKNLSLSTAVSKLSQLGLIVYQDDAVVYSDEIAKGKVIGYSGSKNPGDKVTLDSDIYIVVSAGPEN